MRAPIEILVGKAVIEETPFIRGLFGPRDSAWPPLERLLKAILSCGTPESAYSLQSLASCYGLLRRLIDCDQLSRILIFQGNDDEAATIMLADFALALRFLSDSQMGSHLSRLFDILFTKAQNPEGQYAMVIPSENVNISKFVAQAIYNVCLQLSRLRSTLYGKSQKKWNQTLAWWMSKSLKYQYIVNLRVFFGKTS